MKDALEEVGTGGVMSQGIPGPGVCHHLYTVGVWAVAKSGSWALVVVSPCLWLASCLSLISPNTHFQCDTFWPGVPMQYQGRQGLSPSWPQLRGSWVGWPGRLLPPAPLQVASSRCALCWQSFSRPRPPPLALRPAQPQGTAKCSSGVMARQLAC